jgi:hypothetical protein
MTSYNKLVLLLAVFAGGVASTFSGFAFADGSDNVYPHQHKTATWDHGLVCGNHICSSGELHQNPTPVAPVKGH